MNARKDAYFANTEDGRKGIVRIDLDMVNKMSSPEPVDIIFVLDRSGSMNLYYGNGGVSTSNHPCMNNEHYYEFTGKLGDETKTLTLTVAELIELHGGMDRWDRIFTTLRNRFKIEYGLFADSTQIEISGYNVHYGADGTQINPPTDIPSGWYSPAYNNADGCIDRCIGTSQVLMNMVDELLVSGRTYYHEDNRVGFVGFGDSKNDSSDDTKNRTVYLTKDDDCIDALKEKMEDRYGAGTTTYFAAFDWAKAVVDAGNKEDKSNMHVIFISDGIPEDNEATRAASLAALKDTDVNIHTVGFQLKDSFEDLMNSICNGVGEYVNCNDFSEFSDVIGGIIEKTRSYKTVTLTDTIGADYELLVDSEHRIRLVENGTETLYNSLSEAVDATNNKLQYNSEKKQFTWTDIMPANGMRLSFYVQLKADQKTVDSAIVPSGTYVTNSGNATVTISGDGTPIELPPPAAIHVENATLTVTKSNTPGEEKYVLPGEEIVYTFTAKARGDFGFTDVQVTDSAPEKTTLKTPGKVSIGGDDVEPGQTVQLTGSMTVVVNEGEPGDIENNATFKSETTGGLSAQTNTVTNPIASPVTVQLSATKELTGRPRVTGEFTFQLLDAEDTVIHEAQDVADGSVVFDELSYGKLADLGTHTYTIKEKIPNEYEAPTADTPGLKYDETVYTAEVTVERNTDGTLQQPRVAYSVKDDDDATDDVAVDKPHFRNVYTAQGDAQIFAKKTLTGRDLKAGEFEFQLTAIPDPTVSVLRLMRSSVPAGDVAQNGLTARNDADGHVAFSVIAYDQDYTGANWYALSEVDEGKTYFDYDPAVYHVKVEMLDQDAEGHENVGKLTPVITYYAPNGNGGYDYSEPMAEGTYPEFSNIYHASGTLEIPVEKRIENRSFQPGDAFTFVLEGSDPDAPKPDDTDNPDAGDTGAPDGGEPDGDAPDELPVPMPELTEVTVTPEAGSSVLMKFGPIAFTEAHIGKTYVYTVTETPGEIGGMAYDEEAKTVTVTVIDNEDGTLSFETSVDNGSVQPEGGEQQPEGDDQQPGEPARAENMVFVNRYLSEGTEKPVITKKIELRNFWLNDVFAFTIRPLDGGPLPQKDGADVERVEFRPPVGETAAVVDFGEFHFTHLDDGKTYTYEVVEEQGTDRRMIYDLTPRRFAISVKDDLAGSMVTQTTYEGGEAVFTNTYIPPIDITIRKQWMTAAGIIGANGMPPVQVKLTREEDPEYEIVRELSEKNDWTTVILDQDSNYTYHVTEITNVPHFKPAIERQENTFVVTNVHIPQTGDRSNLLLWAGLLLLSLTGAAALLRRRRDE